MTAWTAYVSSVCVVVIMCVCSFWMATRKARALKKRRAAMEAEWQKIEKYMAMGATPAEILNHQLRMGR